MDHTWKALACFIMMPLAMVIGLTAQAAEHSGTQDEQAACTPDVFRLCLFDIPNEDRIVACLNRNAKSLSPECHDVIVGPQPKSKSSSKR